MSKQPWRMHEHDCPYCQCPGEPFPATVTISTPIISTEDVAIRVTGMIMRALDNDDLPPASRVRL